MIDPAATPETSTGVDLAAVAAYLEAIYPAGWGWQGQISVAHSLPDGTGMPSARFGRPVDARQDTSARDVADFARSARARSAPGVYLRCSTVRADLPAGKRGGAGDSVELPGLWADLDIDGPGHKHDPGKHGGLLLARDEATAAGIVTAAGLPDPTLWVHSGGGLYAWWLFDRRVELDGPRELEERVRWSRISEAWQARLVAGARSMGLHYGPVGNLDRVMGLVGTMNAKPGTVPAMRRMLGGVGVRYAPEALSMLAGQQEAPGVMVPLGGGGTPGAAGDRAQIPFARSPLSAETSTSGPVVASTVREVDHVSPLDDFELRHTWWQILGPLGWTLVKGDPNGGPCDWRRPGASHALSATTGKDASRDRMWVFSDSAGLPTNEPLTKGYVYAQLYHSGDMSAAGRALVGMGYGSAGQARVNGEAWTEGAGGAGRAAGGGSGRAVAPRRLELIAASRMEMRAARWLWAEDGAHWLPLGGVCLLGGREGRGKSTWTYRLIAQLTRGTLPGDLLGTPRSAVIAASEDDWEHTIVPRLLAAGADLDRVHRVDAVEPDRRTGVILPDDLAAMGQLLAGEPEVALLVLDPIVSVIPARTDSHKDHEVRKALEPISALAHGLGITVLGLIHDNKSSGTDLSTRLMGSRAFVAVARAALVCVEEPDDDGAEQGDTAGADPDRVDEGDDGPLAASGVSPVRFLIGQVKNNLEAKAPWSIRYVIRARTVGRDEAVGKDIRGSYVHRVGRSLLRLEERMRAAERPAGTGEGATALRAAQEALRELLAGGPATLQAIRARISDAGSVSWPTVERAARAMRADGELVTVRAQGGYCWSLVTERSRPIPSKPLDGVDGGDGLMVVMADGGPSTVSAKEELSAKEATISHHHTINHHALPARETADGQENVKESVKSGDGLNLTSCCSAPGGTHVPWCRSAGAA